LATTGGSRRFGPMSSVYKRSRLAGWIITRFWYWTSGESSPQAPDSTTSGPWHRSTNQLGCTIQKRDGNWPLDTEGYALGPDDCHRCRRDLATTGGSRRFGPMSSVYKRSRLAGWIITRFWYWTSGESSPQAPDSTTSGPWHRSTNQLGCTIQKRDGNWPLDTEGYALGPDDCHRCRRDLATTGGS
jgi:hypothetical protein